MTQASRREQADKLMNMQGQYQFNPPLITTEEYVKMQEFDNGFEIVQRMERDRQRMEKEKSQNMAQQISQLAQQLNELLGKGMPPEQAMQQVQQMADDMLAKQQQAEMNNGISSQAGGASQQPNPVEAPNGNPNPSAMQAMVQGSK
jgi:type II secretory pathway component PulF